MTEAAWAAVRTLYGYEERAESFYRQAGFRVYLPRQRKLLRGAKILEDGRRVRCRGVGSAVLRPLIDCFLFAELHPGQWLPRDDARRWQHWQFNRCRAFVSDTAIEVLREEEQRHCIFDDRSIAPFVEDEQIEREISPGYRVSAIFKRMKAPDVAVICGMMFNRDMDQAVPLSELHRIEA